MEDVLIVAIVFSFGAFVCTGIYKLIMAKINRTQGIDNDTFDRLAEAFIQHKKEMKKRVQNLEAIIVDSDSSNEDDFQQIEAPQREESRLTNDLHRKDKTRS